MDARSGSLIKTTVNNIKPVTLFVFDDVSEPSLSLNKYQTSPPPPSLPSHRRPALLGMVCFVYSKRPQKVAALEEQLESRRHLAIKAHSAGGGGLGGGLKTPATPAPDKPSTKEEGSNSGEVEVDVAASERMDGWVFDGVEEKQGSALKWRADGDEGGGGGGGADLDDALANFKVDVSYYFRNTVFRLFVCFRPALLGRFFLAWLKQRCRFCGLDWWWV